VQQLLNIALKKLKESNLVFEHFDPLVEDGICGPKTKKAIVIFQRDVVKMKHPDGRIDPGGPTIHALYSVAYSSNTNIIANTNKVKNSPTIHQKQPKKADPKDLVNDPRIRAMLEVIARTEGTHNNFDKGYGRLVYGIVISARYNPEWVGKRSSPDDTKEVYVKDFSRHPEALVEVTSSLRSDACGRYQFLSTTWKSLKLPSFEPYRQDVGAVMLIQKRGAIEPLLRREKPTEDDLDEALSKLSYEWASLPSGREGGGRYGQPAKTFDQVVKMYYRFLGK
jgi:muramidase (phage lysozyme)